MADKKLKNTVSKMEEDFESAYQEARQILIDAKNRAWQAVNAEMVPAYWNVGRIIVEQEQKGQSRAEYGKRVIEEFSKRFAVDIGKGLSPRNLWFIRDFCLTYPKVNALRSELSWTHGVIDKNNKFDYNLKT